MSGRATIFGILNVTPDSFSDGGRYVDAETALAHSRSLITQGADIIDVGGESTRPGAQRVEPALEQKRVIPIIEALAADGIETSIDTMNAGTAREAIRAGASVVNDVSGGLADAGMAALVADSGVRYVVMHWRGQSAEMNALASYDDVVSDVRRELELRLSSLLAEGVGAEQVIIDPGLGFAKNAAHNWAVLSRLDELVAMGYPVLVGASRKRFIGALPHLAEAENPDAVERRDLPSAVVAALAVRSGAWGVRVHDVSSTAVALDVVDAWNTGGAQ